MKRDILIFMSDRHSGSVTGFSGAEVDTPNMDDMAMLLCCSIKPLLEGKKSLKRSVLGL